MGDGADMALAYAINTELDAPFGELDGPDLYNSYEFAGVRHRIPYPEESASLRRAIQNYNRYMENPDDDF